MQPVVEMLRKVHTAFAWLLLFGMVGLAVELLLLRHIDGWWQIAPLVLIGAGVLAQLWYLLQRSVYAVRVLQLTMLLQVASGFVGAWLHFQGNVVYESESNPGLSGRELYEAAVQGATPTLAPGAMMQLGLFGLLMVFCGAALDNARASAEIQSTGNSSV